MSLFFGGEQVEAVLFSPLEGHLTFQGKPAAGATLLLWTAWKDKTGETDAFTANNDGYFSIPAKIVTYQQNPLSQFSVGQRMTVTYQGKEYLIWRGGKSNTHLYGELGGRPQDLTCELTNPDMEAHVEYALIETLCKWNRLIVADIFHHQV